MVTGPVRGLAGCPPALPACSPRAALEQGRNGTQAISPARQAAWSSRLASAAWTSTLGASGARTMELP